jgi:hypothetical protein
MIYRTRLMVLYTHFLIVIDPLIEFFFALCKEKNKFNFVCVQMDHNETCHLKDFVN